MATHFTTKHPFFQRLKFKKKDKNEDSEVITQLFEKMHRLKFRLLDCQNQNQMLRKELLMAKKVMDKELAGCDHMGLECFLKLATAKDFKGRHEHILHLKDKIAEIQKRIHELEGDCPPDDATAEDKRKQVRDKRVDKGIRDISQERPILPNKELKSLIERGCESKRKIEIWRNRNKELSKEIEVVRLELQRLLEKNREGDIAQESYLELDRELRDRQNERIDLRGKLDNSHSRNQLLLEELDLLRESLKKVEIKTKDDSTLIQALSGQQGHLQDYLERQRMMFQNDNLRFREDLREMLVKHSTHSSLLNQIEDVVKEKDDLQRQLRNPVPLKIYANEDDEDRESEAALTPVGSEQITNQTATDVSVPAAAPENDTAAPEADPEQEEIKNEVEKFRSLFRSAQEEVDQLEVVVTSNSHRLMEWMAQLMETRALYARKNAEARELAESLEKISKSVSNKQNNAESSFDHSKNLIEELRIMHDLQREEHQVLQKLGRAIIFNKETDVETYITNIDCFKKLFIDALVILKKKNNEQQEPMTTQDDSDNDE